MMNILYTLFFLPFLMDLSYGNYEVIQCERKNLNISCENHTHIFVNDVHFGPLSAKEKDVYDNENTLKLNSSQIRTMCDDQNTCFIDSIGQDYFHFYSTTPRLFRITYECSNNGYELIGCHEDNKRRLFTRRSKTEASYMSASFCKTFCDADVKYFGTENGNECFCGYDYEVTKLNQSIYKKRPTEECNAVCAENPDENCGKFGLISVYEAKKDILQKKEAIVTGSNILHLSLCSSTTMNIQIKSYQISAYCEKGNSKASVPDTQNEVVWIANDYSTNGYDLGYYFTKHVRINYTCKEIVSNPEFKLTTENETANDGSLTGIIIGVLSGVCIVGVVLIGVCVTKRKQIQNKRQDEQIGSNAAVHGVTEYVNVQNEAHSTGSEKNPGRENTYSVVSKSKQTIKSSKLKEQNDNFSSPDGVYVDTTEGVYDVSNRPRNKIKNTDQAIYSHTTEDVYDSTVTNDCSPNDEENAYDQGFHQAIA